MSSKAMVLEGFGQPLVMRDIELPRVCDGMMLVRILAAGVCGSDLHMRRGRDPRTRLPIILGHEGVGEVVETDGERLSVDGEVLVAGDLVTWNRGVSCGHCHYCSVLKDPSLCYSRQVYGIHTSSDDYPYLNGCYSEYILLRSDTDVFKLPPDIPPQRAVSVSCSGATVAHGFDMVQPTLGDFVLVQGPGPLGLYAVAFAKALGAGCVAVIGGSDTRLSACRQLGADIVLNRHRLSEPERRDVVMEHTKGRGADLVVECAGSPDAVNEGITLTRCGGTYLSAGFGVPSGSVSLDCFEDIVRKNLRLQGVWVSDTRHTKMALSLVLSMGGKVDCMVSHTFNLADANTALDAAEGRDAVKVVLMNNYR